ncbi:PREDICTED: tripartite motif-containing protein 3-like [Branchiostoma belcheri]|uniref:Tripartite motif-containing protein 3-like n=1 Tax=Branchiostoma belcheri TaxID=7741 RepID=A0A6P5A1Q5_BRABE|nr:PREDICTED: tripartite motif-containing protein 3-like [Branchiostoma belcheri]
MCPEFEILKITVTQVNPAAGGRGDAVPAKVETAGPAQATRPLPVDTKEVSGGSSSVRVIIFGDESGPGNLLGARGVAVSPDKIWVADQTKARLQVYNMAGAFQHEFPQEAPGLGYPGKRPVDVSIDRDGHIWVLMTGYPASADRVVQLDREGHLKANFELPDNVPRGATRGMAVGLHNDHVFVTWSDTLYSGGVQAFQPDGKLLWGVGPQQGMKMPMHVAANEEGNVYVSDYNFHYVYVYDASGRYVLKFGGPGRSGGRLNRPRGICVDGSGHVLVVDSESRRVVMYSGRGTYIRDIALPRRAEYPVGVAVGPGGQLVVLNKNTIVVFPRY